MDLLSITAATIAIISALSTSIKAAKKLWGIPDELKNLASELGELDVIAKQLIALTSNREFLGIELQTLHEPYTKLKNAQERFEQRLPETNKNKASILRFSRRAWVLNRGRIKTITRDVTAIRNQLSTIMLTLTLSVLVPSSLNERLTRLDHQ
jgi:hypothetical protein